MVHRGPINFKDNDKRVPLFWGVSAFFLIAWVLLAFNVYSRQDWLLENVLVFLFIWPAVIWYLKGHISSFSYICIMIFLSLHAVGAHYTYSLVPYEQWGQDIFNISVSGVLHWQRNNYDRVLHFLWGFMLFVPLSERIHSANRLTGKSLALFALTLIVSTSTLYEIIEWLAAIVFGGDLGIMYVGSQGDVWDAQKDQVLAMTGAVFAWLAFSKRLPADDH